jgi:hypothetical protein
MLLIEKVEKTKKNKGVPFSDKIFLSFGGFDV